MYHRLFTHSLIEGLLSRFQILTIMNKAIFVIYLF